MSIAPEQLDQLRDLRDHLREEVGGCRTDKVRFPDRAACTLFGQAITYSQLVTRAEALAVSLADLGARPGRCPRTRPGYFRRWRAGFPADVCDADAGPRRLAAPGRRRRAAPVSPG